MSYKFRLGKGEIFLKFLKGNSHTINTWWRNTTLQSNIVVMHVPPSKDAVPETPSDDLHSEKSLG